ncbi:MAG TPA: ABC transporter permease subunit/CPBP intramembrane protease [Polyangia bacterium]|nr:ABC transporter permease subunit/CPBP intramembrane protease [Polyangia bacterium]
MNLARLGVIRLVAGKELRETLRDRRTLGVMLLFPLVVYPLVVPLMLMGAASQVARTEARRSRVAVAGTAGEAVRTRLAKHPKTFEVLPAPADAAAAVTGARVDAVAIATPADANRTRVDVVYDGAREESTQAHVRLQEVLGGELAPGCGPLFAMSDRNVAPKESESAYLLSKLLPLIIVVVVGLGAFHPAIDITAGERERGTLETILSSPVNRHDLMAGKIVAVAALSALTGLLNLASMSLTTLEGARLVGGAAPAMVVPWSRALATLFAVVVPASFLFASIMVAIGAMARSHKEAQTLLTPVYFVCLTPSIMASVGDWQLTGAVALVPGVNIMLLARDLILGKASLGLSIVVVAMTLACGALALSLAARLYDSERLLAADDGALGLMAWLRRLAGIEPRSAAPAPTSTSGPTAGHALAVFGVAYVLLFFVFIPLQAWRLTPGLVLTEWVGLLGIVAAYARGTGQRVRDVLRVRRVPARALAGATLIGASAWIVVGFVAEWLVPAPKELVEKLRHMIAPEDGHLAVGLFLMALTPAVCEEALFRGPILRGLAARLPRVPAAIVTGLLFGLYHVDAWRLLPTGVLGVFLSLIALETGSIVPAMVTHFVNNACLLVITYAGRGSDPDDFNRPTQLAIFGAGLVVLAAGAALVRGARARDATV